ncbi:MAG: hypothetical protein AUH39_00185 [Chloroflexi bacterium 13_1_40CM_67_9]|nr:MAG: hypothetical protein AUH39_00185 [Chloroflexi bacterium 13_1_40CM_67_9]
MRPRFWLIANVAIATMVVSALAPGGVFAPTPAGAASEDQLAALDEVNRARVAAGVRPAQLNDALSRAAAAHAAYVAAFPLFSGHEESGGAGSTGRTPADRARAAGYPTSDVGEVQAYCAPCALPVGASRARDDVRRYLLSIYHRIGLLAPDVTEIGYGAVTTARGVSANVIDTGYDWKAPANIWARWPAPNSIGAPTSWDGVESPNPAPGVPRPLGPAVTIAISNADSVSIQPYVANVVPVGGSLTGPEGPVAVITEVNERFASLLPKAPLRSATAYTVRFDLEIKGVPKVDTWTFTTERTISPPRNLAVYYGDSGRVFGWDAPRDGPPGVYAIERNGQVFATIPGDQTYYIDPEPQAAATFRITAFADAASVRSTGGPPLSSDVFAGPIPKRPVYWSKWLSQSPYPTLRPGEMADLFFAFRNTGTEPWVRGVWGQEANLGLNGDNKEPYRLRMDVNWLWDDRVATTVEPVVAPLQVGTFRFKLRAPPAPGVYRFSIRPVIDGTVWMPDEGVFLTITVVAAQP